MTQPTLPTAEQQQQAAVEVFAQYEPPLYEAYLEMMLEWLAAVRVAVFAGGVTRLGLVPDPMAVFSQTPKWTTLSSRYTDQVARDVLAAPYRDLFADGTVFDSRPFVRNWIADTENRLTAVPNEVYGAVAQIIDSGTVNGASIPDVTDQVEQLFGDTGVQRWKNRARTVARTEVVGAYNGGLHDAFTMVAESDPGTVYVHRWLATEDQRTRPDHREADGQVQPFGTPFTVGGFQMMYPHDPTAPAKEVVNCRCVELMEIKNEPTKMSNRQYKGGGTLSAAAYLATTADPIELTGFDLDPEMVTFFKEASSAATLAGRANGKVSLLQAACTDGQFCMQTHKPGLCKGQKRGQTEPGVQEESTKTPAQVAKTAVAGLTEALRQAQQIAIQNATANPKLAARARKAMADYSKALKPHQQTLAEAARKDSKAKATGEQDTRQQDSADISAKNKATRKHDSLEKRAQAIIDRRKRTAEQTAKLKKMTPKQRTAYHKAQAATNRATRTAQENKTLKDAGK